MGSILRQAFESHRSMFEALLESQAGAIERIGRRIVETLAGGGKILSFGNGGSAADAQHLVCELVGRFEGDRPGLAAIALSTNTSTLTAVGNDFGFNQVFARQIEALARPGDLCLGISTSGNSMNVVLALRCARAMGVATAGLAGGNGGRMRPCCDDIVIVPQQRTCRIQEAHLFCVHVWCAMVDAETTKRK
ncbi:hypothetical protein AMJ85_06280 [candidate division BRC1 bacterium SM23_51]|nr:MAG: hypothetical protein AMJ85_06280 [candidate division BRC1 bacterium SM23_51]